jgi:hypothetical protein
MQEPREGGKRGARTGPGGDHRHHPQRRDRDVPERLEEVLLGPPQDNRVALRRVVPVLPARPDAVDDERDQEEPEVPPQRVEVGGSRAVGVAAAEEREPVREPHREEELRHDGIGVAAVRVVVREDGQRRPHGGV